MFKSRFTGDEMICVVHLIFPCSIGIRARMRRMTRTSGIMSKRGFLMKHPIENVTNNNWDETENQEPHFLQRAPCCSSGAPYHADGGADEPEVEL